MSEATMDTGGVMPEEFNLSGAAIDDVEEPLVFVDEEADSDDADVEETHLPGTDGYDDAIKIYLRDIQRTPLLTADSEKELAAKVAKGDKAARNLMIESNLRLVIKLAKRYLNRGLPFLDLIEEGNLGLMKAVERFSLEKECRFSTYATWWIRQSIERALVNQARTIRLPVHVSDDISRMMKVSRSLSHQLQREPSAHEIAEAMEAKLSYVRKLMMLVRRTCSMDSPVGDGSDYLLIDTIEDVSSVAPSQLIEDINSYQRVEDCLEGLTESEREILALRFGLGDREPQTLDTIGQQFGVTRERIRQIESKTLEKLRRKSEN